MPFRPLQYVPVTCGFLLLSAVAGISSAATIFGNIDTSGGAVAGTQNYGGSLGLDFNVTDPAGATATRIGVWDANQDGLFQAVGVETVPGTITAYIYDRVTQTAVIGPIAVTTANSTLTGAYRFVDVADVLLPAGFQGTVVAEGYNAAELNGNANTGGPAVTFNQVGLTQVGNRYGNAGAYPGNGDAGPGGSIGFYAAGNFEYVAVPEPTALGLFGAAGLVVLRRRRR